MNHRIVRSEHRVPADVVERLRDLGVATVHEAQGRTGLLAPSIRPIIDGVGIAGSAVTVVSQAGDNLMLHAAVEQVGPGDVVVVTTSSPSTDGMFGELLATSMRAHGAIGLVTEAGVRDVAALRDMGFPVWAQAIHSQGTVKATAGSVNVEAVVAGALVRPGDVIVADDDGVVVVPFERAAEVAEVGAKRVANEQAKREVLASGMLGLDLYDLRGLLESLQVEYVDDEAAADIQGASRG